MHWTVALVLLRSFLLQGQEPPARPHFAIVSIKPTVAIPNGKTFHLTPSGGFRAGNYSLKDLIRLGWDVRNFQISGGPGWLDTDKYNVEAKPELPFAAHSTEGFKLLGEMVQSVLEDRFQLKVHPQIKEMSVYFLVVATGGPKLKRTGDATDASTQMRDNDGHMWATKFDMSLLARYLGGELERAVIDKTGLGGVYDFELKWSPDQKPTPAGDIGPSFSTALREQLGLKLESGKGPVQTIVVDYAEKASPN
jgi:uncharacterized protein (TIGR03435 family)